MPPFPAVSSTTRRRALARARRGTVLVQVGIMLVALVAFGALAVDFAGHQVTSTELQTVADAAALSAVVTLQRSTAADPTTAAKNRAVATGQANAVQGGDGPIAATDVEIGCWNNATRTFTTPPAGACAIRNAARVTVQKAGRSILSSVFQNVYGMALPTPRKQATAWLANIIATNCVQPWALPYSALYKLATGSAPSPVNTQLTQAQIASLNSKTTAQRVITIVGKGQPMGTAQGYWKGFNYGGNAGNPDFMQGVVSCKNYVLSVSGDEGVTITGNPGQIIGRVTTAMTTTFQSQGDTYQPFCSGNTSTNAGCYASTGTLGKVTKVSWGNDVSTGSNAVDFMVFSKFTVLCYFTGVSTQVCPYNGATGWPEGTIVGLVWEIVPGTIADDDVLGNETSTNQKIMLVQ